MLCLAKPEAEMWIVLYPVWVWRERVSLGQCEQDRPGRASQGQSLTLSCQGQASQRLGQSYFVSNRLDTQSELQSVLTKYRSSPEKIRIINEPPRVRPETVSCWQWRHWHCDLLIGKFAARSGSYFHLGRLLWEKLETWSTLDSNDRSWDLLEPTLQSFSDI